MFTKDEIDLLITGLDAITKAEVSSDMVGDMLTAMVSKNEEQMAEVNAKRAKAKEAQDEARRDRQMRINILKGKLAQIALDLKSETPFGAVTSVDPTR